MMNFLKRRHVNKLLNTIAIVALILILTFCFGSGKRSTMTLIVDICIAVLMATSLNIAAGSLGEIVLGHAGFMCIGAYSAGIFFTVTGARANFGYYLIALLIGGVAAGICGLIVGIPSLRVRGDYLAIVTLGFGEIVRTVFLNLNVCGNLQGEMLHIPDILSPVTSGNMCILISAATVVLCVCIIYIFMTSRHGRAILAIREDEIAADAVGIPVVRYKVLAFTLSAIFAGIGGAMIAQTNGQITANYFNLDRSVNYLVMVVFGGLGSYTGGILSAIFLTWLNFQLIDLNQLRMVLYAVILILIMLFKPTGLFGIKEFSLRGTIVNFKVYVKALWQGILDFPKDCKKNFINFINKIKGFFKEKFSRTNGVPHVEDSTEHNELIEEVVSHD